MICEIITIVISGLALVISLWAVRIARKSYRSTLKAVFYCNDYRIELSQQKIIFNIENLAQTIKIVSIKVISNNINHRDPKLPMDLCTKDSTPVAFIYKGDLSNIGQAVIEFDIVYSDKDNNQHISRLTLKNRKVTFTPRS